MKSVPIEEVAEVLKVIAHPDRLRILLFLAENKGVSVSQIQSAGGLKQSITSQHLNALRRNGVLTAQRAGNTTLYSLASRKVLSVISCISQCKLGGAQNG